jgi:hypothetical protein
MDKRYQVFVSSTYADLKEERRRVIQALMEMDCIPAGMELFPAADQEQFEFIKRVIDDCDYYLLVIGGRYGSVTPEGVSFTEQEYDYAVSRGLKVIALLHEDPDSIPFGKSEQDPVLRERLRQFRKRVSEGRLVRFWKTADELPGLVSLSMSKATKMFPAVGWVRANKTASEDILLEINDLRKKNEDLRSSLAELSISAQPKLDDLATLDEQITLHGTYQGAGRYGGRWQVSLSWKEVFALVSPWLIQFPNEYSVKNVLADALFKRADTGGFNHHLDDQDFKTVSVQLAALGLVKLTYGETTKGGMALFWSLTSVGEKLMYELRSVRTANNITKTV